MHVTLAIPVPAISSGTVIRAHAGLLFAKLPAAFINAACEVTRFDGSLLKGQIVGFENDVVTIAPFGSLEGITTGASVRCESAPLMASIPENPIGCVLDTFGKVLFQQEPGEPKGSKDIPLSTPAPNPLALRCINTQMQTGVRSVDAYCPIGKGQRVGLFAGPGTGKSTLLATITKNSNADVIVLGLIGERGREIQEFVHDTLGEGGLRRAVVVAATSDAPAISRQYAAYTATAIAERYRSKGKDVLLLIDSLTRTARAIREVNLAAGELPVRQGYTPSVYSELPKLLERPGNTQEGSITAIYTVLTTGSGKNDALAEEVVSLLDGHMKLSEKRAIRGIYPAVDPLESLSRLAPRLLSEHVLQTVQKSRAAIQLLEDEKEFLQFGAEASAELAAALQMEEALEDFCRQSHHEVSTIEETHRALQNIIAQHEAL